MKKQKNESTLPEKKVAIQELIKPVDIQNEEQFFQVQALCGEFGAGIECKGVNKSIDDDSDLLF